MKVIIVNTYLQRGGPVVLAELCRCLVSLGYDARLLMAYRLPMNEHDSKTFRRDFTISQIKALRRVIIGKFLPFESIRRKIDYQFYFPKYAKGCKRQLLPFYNRRNTIVIYPEVIYGNPLKSRYVVRWLLNKFYYFNMPNSFEKSDFFVGYRDVFKNGYEITLPNLHILSFDDELYKRKNFGKRKGNCYFIGKGQSRSDIPENLSGPVIDRMSEEEKVNTLNEREFFYSYDTQTFYSEIAVVCGCKSIVVLEEGKTVKDYRKEDDNTFGISFGDDEKELKRAEITRTILLKNMENIKSNNIKSAAIFMQSLLSYIDL